MVCCSACGAQIAQGSSFCSGCGRPITAFAVPVTRRKTSPFTMLLAIFFGMVLLGMMINAFSGSPEVIAPAAASDLRAPSNTPEGLIERCGKPDRDSSTAYDKPRPPIVSRIIGYKKQRVKFLFFPKGSPVGSPPPYDFELMGTTDYQSNNPIQPPEAHKRMRCW